VRTDKKSFHKADKKSPSKVHRQGVVGYSKKSALLEEAITHMNTGKYGRSSAALKELLALDPQNAEARRLFATLHLRLGSLVTAREAFESLANEAVGRQDYWLAESLLKEYLSAGPRCIPFLELLAHVYHEKGDDMAAVAELGKAVEILLEDPDPDNPKKPSQLYQRIRELAPASPVAFKFASMFDVETGEFLAHRPPSAEPSQAAAVTEPALQSAHTMETTSPAPEVMPWELTDGAPVAVSSPATSLPAAESPLLQPTAELIATPLPELQEQPNSPVAPPPADHVPPEVAAFTVSPAVENKVEAPIFEPPAGLDVELPRTLDTKSIWQQEEESVSPTIVEPETPPHRTEEETTQQESVLPPGSSLSTMPSEQVADPAGQFSISALAVEPPIDNPPQPEPTAVGQSAWSFVSSKAPVSPTVASADTLPVSEPAAAESAASAADSSSLSSSASAETVTSPGSFTWKSIFDSAWKIVGPAAPSASVTVNQEPAEAPVEPVAFASSVAEPPADAALGTLAATTEHLAPNTSASSEPITTVPVADPVSEPPVDTANVVNFSSTAFVREKEPAPPETTSIVEQSTPVEPTFAYVSPPPEEPSPAPLPSSFSLVEEEQVIPPPVESLWREPLQQEPLKASQSAAIEPPVESAAEPSPPLIERPAPTVEPSPVAQAPQALVAPPLETSEPTPPAHWRTGEVAVQVHRPAEKKRRWDQDTGETEKPVTSPSPTYDEPLEPLSDLGQTDALESPVALPPEPVIEPPVDTRPEWAQASDTITLTPRSQAPAWRESTGEVSHVSAEPTPSVAASAVDVLFGSSGRVERETFTHTRERISHPTRRPWILSRLARLRIAFVSLIWSCFSTTRAFVLFCISLAVFSLVMVTVGVGAVGLAWVLMEEAPNQRYQNLQSIPQRLLTQHEKNGYFLLLGFDAPAGRDPVQVGYERKPDEGDLPAATACMTTGNSGSGPAGSASANVVQGWFKSGDPLGQSKASGQTVKSLVAQEATSLDRYQRWTSMPFDDWGYGQIMSPNCGRILLAHRLFVLDGFAQDTGTGLTRLEKDIEAWRLTLGQSKTLMVKMLAAVAIRDDVTVISSLLTRPETDANTINRLAKLVRPLDQVELSVRWPMQSHYVWATHAVPAELKKVRSEDHPLYVSVAALLPVPVQRRANAYADYYDAANKAVAEGRYTKLPQASTFIRTSQAGLFDYLANPIEHVLGIQPLPHWDPYVGQMVETDAQLRLASLQVLVRRGSQEKEVLTRLAKAGQAYYDPFTGLPMLVNQQKRLLYSVGRDGKDQDGDREHDVVVTIPVSQPVINEPSRPSR